MLDSIISFSGLPIRMGASEQSFGLLVKPEDILNTYRLGTHQFSQTLSLKDGGFQQHIVRK